MRNQRASFLPANISHISPPVIKFRPDNQVKTVSSVGFPRKMAEKAAASTNGACIGQAICRNPDAITTS
ncbi:hypothetical protein KL86PLE_130604 [uncultured Pleomorphomonas sp.]|uniref:Uncharacterized protein n=1 Tax=uncultured Pleomorphomonas sp. TaxID=442121 RepID=A0A212LCB0_9HYPH|nr:hypothetical protein KL86PLE_130604 [uncultured Pleomorphomonas sp.]